MAKKKSLSPEEREREELLERYFKKRMRQVQDEWIERMRAEEDAEKKKSA